MELSSGHETHETQFHVSQLWNTPDNLQKLKPSWPVVRLRSCVTVSVGFTSARAASSSARELLAARSLAHSLTRTERYRLRLPKHRQVPGFSRESPLFLAGLGSPTVFHCNCYDVRVSVHPNGLLKTTTRIDWFHSLLVVHGERHAGLLQTSDPARSSTEKVRWFFPSYT